MPQMSDRLRKRADRALIEKIVPVIEAAINTIADEIYADTRRQFQTTHAPEIRLGADNMATYAVLSELVRLLAQNPDMESAFRIRGQFSVERVDQWLERHR